MRRYLLLLLSIFCFNLVSAQYCPPLSGKLGEYNSFHVTAGYGVTKMYGDVSNNSDVGYAGTIQVDYQFFPGLYIGLESQFGSLKTNVNSNEDPRQSHNNYLAGGLVLTAHPFLLLSDTKVHRRQLIDVIVESIFVGVGSLYVVNNYDNIYRSLINYSTYGAIDHFDEDGDAVFKSRTRSLIFPSINVGSVIPLNQNSLTKSNILSLVLKAQMNFGRNDLLDGYTPYNSAAVRIQGQSDVYSFYSLGLRYSF